MEELLKELGYSEEQITAIKEGMKGKSIFTASEENADLRLKKLGEDMQTKDGELTRVNGILEELEKNNKGNEDLQKTIEDYKNENAKLKDEQHEKDIENALRFELLAQKANSGDIDYLIFKIKENQTDESKIDVDSEGKLKNFNIEDIQKEYKNHFESSEETFVDVKKLGGKGDKEEENQEPKNLTQALMDAYAPKDEM